MAEIIQKHALVTLDSKLSEIPREWVEQIEWRIHRGGFLPCWIWTGSLNGKSLPIFIKDGVVVQARRFVMEMFYEFDKKHYVFNICDHRNCLNPAHLVVTAETPRAWVKRQG